MNVFNVFKMEGMPEDEKAQEDLVRKMFTVDVMHFHGEDGSYYVVRKTAFEDTDGVKVTKLDPATDRELMHELATVFLEYERENSQQA